MPKDPKRPTVPFQRWMTFVRNHAKAIIASDFFIVVTATFRLVYVLVIMEIGTRRILADDALFPTVARSDLRARLRAAQDEREATHPRPTAKKQFHPVAEALVRVYRQEADRQRLLVKKAQLTESRLLFVVSALNKLSQDEDFVNLLRAESLDTLATYLAERSGSARRIENGQTSPDRI